MNAFYSLGGGWEVDKESEDPGLWHLHKLEKHLVCVVTVGDDLPSHCDCGVEVPGEVLSLYLDEVRSYLYI